MTIFGWDMSHYDAPDIGNAIEQGISFITHKIGGDRNDPEAAQWWADAKNDRSRVLLGGYWVLRPDLWGSPAASAGGFVGQLDRVCPGWRDAPFILQADCEKWNGNESTVPGISEINAFCDRLRSLAPKLMPVAYVPEWVYGSSVKGLRYPIWASSYVTGSGNFKSLYPGDNSSRWDAYGGKVPAILQYSSKAAIGGQTTCDANAYRGTPAQLTALLAPGWAQEGIDDMDLTQDNLDAIAKAVHAWKITDYADTAKPQRQLALSTWVGYSDDRRNDILNAVNAGTAKILTALDVAAVDDDVDESALSASIVSGVLAGLAGTAGDAETIAALVVNALPKDLAERVIDEMGARLAERVQNDAQNG
jgi:hypothetical protein